MKVSAGERVRAFQVPGFRGELVVGRQPEDLESAVESLVDPANARETIHWGRNYLYLSDLPRAGSSLPVVVKQFRNQGLEARWRRRRRGSKAERSWRVALALEEAGVSTPAPVLLIESLAPEGPSFFVSEHVPDSFEVRHLFRAINTGRVERDFPQVDLDCFFDPLGRALRRMHDAGIWHRDVSVGNLLVRYREPGGAPHFYLLDLNRARTGHRLGVWRRSRDLCRLRIFEASHQETFLRGYWGADARAWPLKRLAYSVAHRTFRLRSDLRDSMRRGRLRNPFSRRTHHAHIPAAPEDVSPRDRSVWDRLSDQPHQHAGRWQRFGVRLADLHEHGREILAAARVSPAVWKRYRQLVSAEREPHPWGGIGVGLRPWSQDPEALLGALEASGVRRCLLRLHPWEAHHGDEERTARALWERGFELAFTLPQNRELVRDPARWRAAVQELGERFTPYGRHFQVGQAVNRSKWGIWKASEYEGLLAAADEILRRWEGVEIFGPGVIDFELHATAAILNLPWNGLRLDGVASLLYVDRRGAPENRQLGFDTPAKVALLKAIVETGRNCGDRSWITEVNWPLWEGPHSPAGRAVSVDEETQADYLVRYYLLALGTGLVERVYWWQLVARGYGLACPEEGGTLRLRPSFHALSTLHRLLEGSTYLGDLPAAEPGRLQHFRSPEGEEIVVGWSTGKPVTARLPAPPERVTGRDGRTRPGGRPNVDLTGSPRYFHLGR